MNMIVCVKQVPDPEIPPSSFKINPVTKSAIAAGLVLNPFDGNALEAALRIKDCHGGRITAISLGPSSAQDILRQSLAVGADSAVLLDDPAFEGSDSWSTAYTLAMAIKKMGKFDLILCGRQAADWNAGQVGLGIAEFLGIPSVTTARRVDLENGKVRVERVIEDGYEIIEVALPALITVTNELGQLRYATTKGIMSAARKEITAWNAQVLGAEAAKLGAAGSRVKLLDLYIPAREVKCEIIQGQTPEQAAANLAHRLREENLL